MSPNLSVRISLSAIDEMRFGIKTARATGVTFASVPTVWDFCVANDVRFLIARCLASDLAAVQAMERKGGFLTDTLVYYSHNLVKTPIPIDTSKTTIRPIQPGEESHVEAIAAESFRGYFGHYHADPRLDRDRCDEAYVPWAAQSCISREIADEVLVAESLGGLVGFATLRFNSPEEGEGVLFGVSPEAQGQGIYRAFMIHSMEWSKARGCTRQIVSTQITNTAVQKVWTRLGFEPSHAYYTLHCWFD